MGFYHSLLLPPLLDWAMKNDELKRIRERLIPLARGRVLEVGCGSGLNLPYYGDDVKELWAIDPNPALISMACRRAKDLPFSIEFLERTAETIPMDDRSFDTVVTTWTLCSVSDIGSALHEMRRVLKPGGLLLFAEHGTAPDAAVRSWQDRLTPFWKRIAGGCHLNRKPDDELRAAGLRIDRLENAIHPRPAAVYLHVRRAGQCVPRRCGSGRLDAPRSPKGTGSTARSQSSKSSQCPPDGLTRGRACSAAREASYSRPLS